MEHSKRSISKRILSLGLALGIAGAAAALDGCAVGPDFVRPAPPKEDRYTAGPTPVQIAPAGGAAGQEIHLGQEIAAQWWTLFNVPALDGVLKEALEKSPTLAAARATLAANLEAVTAARGGFFPQLDASAGFTRQKPSAFSQQNSFPGANTQSTDLYSLGATVSYAPDVFGGLRRKVEQQQSLAEYQRDELAAAYLSLTGNSVTQAVTIASLRAQIQATEDVIADDEQNLALVRLKYEAGKAARTDVLTAETQLASDRTGLPPLRQQLSAARHALSILSGRGPGEWSPPDFDLNAFRLPHDLPLTLPAELVRRRPDILAAEAQLHASSAAIGVAAAQLYPALTLSGSLGQEAPGIDTLFKEINQFWSLAANLSGPLFHGGSLRAQKRAAVDTYHATLATYEQTVLQGLQQVADTLQALQHDAQLMAAAAQLLQTANDSLALQRLSYQSGKSDILQLIIAERAYQEARLTYARAGAQQLLDTTQLFVALGGGWWQTEIAHASG
ncbi:MAG: efflux transporter outer membrane subunit [Desulfobacteraceae bacterium]|nr:efflux transporter outer membrane subunit [Desulfobacteraceae bacterium]